MREWIQDKNKQLMHNQHLVPIISDALSRVNAVLLGAAAAAVGGAFLGVGAAHAGLTALFHPVKVVCPHADESQQDECNYDVSKIHVQRTCPAFSFLSPLMQR